jgi:hypothetical protein
MMKMKIWLVLVLAILLMALLSACGVSEGGSTSVSQTPKAYKTYTFEGSISELVFDGGNVIATQGYPLGK